MASTVRTMGWADTAVLLRRIAKRLKHEIPNIHVKRFAEITQKKLQEGIRKQTFKLAPLTKHYLRRKVREGYDRRILMRSSEYVDSIQIFKQGRRIWGVGIPVRKKSHKKTLEMWKLAHYLEYGTKRMPARPHWRPVIAWVEKAWPKYIPGRVIKIVRSTR